jgi:hypothetical protein
VEEGHGIEKQSIVLANGMAFQVSKGYSKEDMICIFSTNLILTHGWLNSPLRDPQTSISQLVCPASAISYGSLISQLNAALLLRRIAASLSAQALVTIALSFHILII